MNLEGVPRCKTVYPLPSSPGDSFKWGAWACTNSSCKVIWISPLAGVERGSSLCPRCRRVDRYLPKPWWWISKVEDLPLVGESGLDWEKRKRGQHVIPAQEGVS